MKPAKAGFFKHEDIPRYAHDRSSDCTDMILDCAGKTIDLASPCVMGILNVTPDSFSDGGRFNGIDAAVEQAVSMVEQGAAIIDIGGESTRPGAAYVSAEEELDRVIPVIKALHTKLPVPLSIDTSKPEVMRAAVDAGVGLINDVRALRQPDSLEVAAELAVPICLMHMQGGPCTMQQAPHYDDVVEQVYTFLMERAEICLRAGISHERIVIDPGFGFGKNAEHNYSLLRHLPRFIGSGYPVLVGMSRKSMIGHVLDTPVDERLHGSLALAVLAVWMGATIIRVHDVRPTVEALKIVDATRSAP